MSKGLLVRPSLGLKWKASPVSVSEDRVPKHARAARLEGSGSTHATSHEMSLPSMPVEVSSSLSSGVCTEVVDIGESRVGTDEVILPSPEAALVPKDGASLGIVCAEEHPVCMDAEIIDTTATAPPSVQHLESIFRRGKATSSKIRDKFAAARASTEEFSSKLLHEKEVVEKDRATLQ
ncbi:hypothetical protein LIER_03332 [Lithospermum erythrorhizon]|uniref:Uncharacterized protein n=1 Tax=Lithospermum erythrorhizon TaxID=34254 RepID=A0AAV3NU85_LITER